MNTKKVRRIIREELAHELHYNSGQSVRDAITRIESGVVNLYAAQDQSKFDDAIGERPIPLVEVVNPSSDGSLTSEEPGLSKSQVGGELLQCCRCLDLVHVSHPVVVPHNYYINGMSIKDLIAAANRK